MQQATELSEAKQWQSEAHRLSNLVTEHQSEIEQLRYHYFAHSSQPSVHAPAAICDRMPNPSMMLVGHQEPLMGEAVFPSELLPAGGAHLLGAQDHWRLPIPLAAQAPTAQALQQNEPQLPQPHSGFQDLHTKHKFHEWVSANRPEACVPPAFAVPYNQINIGSAVDIKTEVSTFSAPYDQPDNSSNRNEALLLDAACDAFDTISELPGSLSEAHVGRGAGSGGASCQLRLHDQATGIFEEFPSGEDSSFRGSSTISDRMLETALSGSVVKSGAMRWRDVIRACLGFGFEPDVEVAYQSWRCMDRLCGHVLLLTFYCAFGLAQGGLLANPHKLVVTVGGAFAWTEASGTLMGSLMDSEVWTGSLLFSYLPVFYTVQIALVLSIVFFWTMERVSAFMTRHTRFLQPIAMLWCGVGHAACIIAVSKTLNPPTSHEATHCITLILFRPLVTKILTDPPAWWLLLLLIGQISYILMAAPADVQTSLMQAARPGSVVHWRVCLSYFVIIWLEWSRRSQFIQTLVLCQSRRGAIKGPCVDSNL